MVRSLSSLRTSLLVSLLLVSFLPAQADAKSSRKKRHSTKAKVSSTEKSRVRPVALKLEAQTQAPFSTVVLDAGHGGHDPGGIRSNLIPEKGVALDVVRRMASHLQSAGIRVVLTRSDDTFVSLPERVAIGNAQKDAIFVSVHFNSGLRVGARGVETFYSSSAGAPLASRIQSNLSGITTGDNRGVKYARFYVLRESKIRAVLAECGFLTNPTDAALASDPNYRERLAVQIAGAIIDYHRSVSLPNNTAAKPTPSDDSAT